MVSRGRRRGGPIHDEVAQGGEVLVTPRNGERQERRQGETGGAAVLIQPVSYTHLTLPTIYPV